jgi:hypothetical protein
MFSGKDASSLDALSQLYALQHPRQGSSLQNSMAYYQRMETGQLLELKSYESKPLLPRLLPELYNGEHNKDGYMVRKMPLFEVAGNKL